MNHAHSLVPTFFHVFEKIVGYFSRPTFNLWYVSWYFSIVMLKNYILMVMKISSYKFQLKFSVLLHDPTERRAHEYKPNFFFFWGGDSYRGILRK